MSPTVRWYFLSFSVLNIQFGGSSPVKPSPLSALISKGAVPMVMLPTKPGTSLFDQQPKKEDPVSSLFAPQQPVMPSVQAQVVAPQPVAPSGSAQLQVFLLVLPFDLVEPT